MTVYIILTLIINVPVSVAWFEDYFGCFLETILTFYIYLLDLSMIHFYLHFEY